MNRTLQARLAKLEARHTPPTLSAVVVIPWCEWPETEEAWNATTTAYPHGRLFIPSQMTIEEWEANVPMMQAPL